MPRRALIWAVALGVTLVAPIAAHDLSEEIDQVAELMSLRPGMKVADVGAGDGDISEELADRLGRSGHVYVTEVSDSSLSRLRRRFKRIENTSVVEGAADDTELPDACCDAILLRYVYHHMSQRSEMRSSLRRSLRPGGLLLIIEKNEPGDGVAAEELIADMTKDGFKVESRHPEWGAHEGHYGIVMRLAEEP